MIIIKKKLGYYNFVEHRLRTNLLDDCKYVDFLTYICIVQASVK